MTALTDLSAISLTSTAKAAALKKGVDLAGLVTLAKEHVMELQRVLNSVISLHPTTGADATNFAALQAVVAELA
jgi:hypothetical protein